MEDKAGVEGDADREIATLGSRLIYENRWMRLREDAIRRRDGTQGIYGVVEKPDFVVVAPVEPDGSVHLVEQYRYPVGARYWEFPQGTWEGEPDADPLALARGELEEETGLAAAEMIDAGYLLQGYGFSTQGYHVFLARGLTPTARRLDPEEQGLITRRFPAAELTRMIREGEIQDASTVAAMGLLVLKGLMRA